MKWFTSLLFITSSIFAINVDVHWKAFKTPLKIGVGGKFDAIKVSGNRLKNLKISINTLSVNSNNRGRDETLVKSFFKVQNVTNIDATVKKIERDIIVIEINMNKIKRDVPMRLIRNGDMIKAVGYIDLADFGMLPSLKSINTSCFTLHAGKTWQDIEIEVEISDLQ